LPRNARELGRKGFFIDFNTKGFAQCRSAIEQSVQLFPFLIKPWSKAETTDRNSKLPPFVHVNFK
jgi:hypothetical protein